MRRSRLLAGTAVMAIAFCGVSAHADNAAAPDGGAEEPAAPTERPSDDEMFGAMPASAKPNATTAAPTSGPPATNRDDAILGGGPGPAQTGEIAAANPLTIGGQFYLRTQVSALQDQKPQDWKLSAPSLLDGYFDARPNERVRGLVLARMRFDPTASTATTGLALPTAGGFGTQSPGTGPGPSVALDQMWMRFDIKRTVFVTAGKQHVKWGTGRFWTPTDYLHPVRRDPLVVFDARTGVTMLKLHLPVESRGWNFYGMGLVEGTDVINTAGKVAGAARAEFAFSGGELGIDIYGQRGQRPRLGLDASTGLWDFDVYVDVGLRSGRDVTLLRLTGITDPEADFAARFERYHPDGSVVQATAGLTWSAKYNDNDIVTLGSEVFLNPQAGYGDTKLYPYLWLDNRFIPFYTGRGYGSVFVSLPRPYSWDRTSFTFSTLANASDRSFLSRLDYSFILLTHITFEVFGQVHYGTDSGELRLGQTIGPISISPQLFDLGAALRLNI